MNRIRSRIYITKIYNLSICTKTYINPIINLCNITKHIIKPNLSQFISILFQSAKFALITSAPTSKRESIISSKSKYTDYTLKGTKPYQNSKIIPLKVQFQIMFIKIYKICTYVNFIKHNDTNTHKQRSTHI